SLLTVSCSDEDSNNSGDQVGKKGQKGKRPSATIPVEVVKPIIDTAASYYVTTATLEPSSDAKINARTVGVVKKIIHEEGDDVESGDILLVLEDDDQQLRLKQATQKLESTTREFKRLSKMKRTGAVSSTEWDAAEAAYQTAITDEELAQLSLSYTRVTAPFKGRVVWRDVDLGAHVSQGQLLYRMMAIDPLLVRVHIPASRLGEVAQGQMVKLKVDSLKSELNALVDLVSPIVDPTTGTIKITLRLDQYPSTVRPGDFTEVHMVTEKRENSLLVPSISIIEERGNNFLYVIENNKAVRKSVEVGFIMNDLTEVLKGLNEKDQIVFKGQRNLNDGISVEILSSTNGEIKQSNAQLKEQDKIKSENENNKKSRKNRGSK
ncbi:MAG: efflux RND transporter periplasmic adaptor subunit, partial [Kangiellaceae bacterium]